MRLERHIVGMLVAVCAVACTGADKGAEGGAKAGEMAHSTMAGVYDAEQAKRGEDVYGMQCSSCHAALGNHTGPVFRQRWAGSTVADLFWYVSANMPKSDPGVLSQQEYLDVTAYLLKMNNMPEGKTALTADTVALKAITIDTIGTKR